MNRKIGMVSSCITLISVILFAIFMLFNMSFAAYAICILLSGGYLVMVSAYAVYARQKVEAAKYAGIAFAVIYAVFVMLVYYAQITTLVQSNLTEQAAQLLDYRKFGLFFLMIFLDMGCLPFPRSLLDLQSCPKVKRAKY